MTYHVQWSQIEAECDGYREGFVATFHKYEGLPTDEQDGQGRTIKVSAPSFARHMKIPESTFKEWVRKAAHTPLAPGQTKEAKDERKARSLVRNKPQTVTDAIMDAPDEVQDEIFHELKLRRAGIDTSPAARKAAEAAGNEYAGAIRQSIATTHIELCIQALNDAADQLAEAVTEDVVTPEGLDRIDEAHARFVTTRHEADFKVEATERR